MFDDINNHNLKDASAIKFIAWFTIIIQSLFPISMNFIPSFAVAQSNTLQQWDNVETQPYIIKDGETIDNVAKKLNLSFSQLAKLNQFRIFSRGFENVKPGDEIDVPVNTGTPGNAANTLPVKMLYSDSTSTNITRNMNKTTHAENFGFIRSSDSANDIARTMINSAATEEIQKWLSQWGTTRAQVNLDKKLSLDGNSIDTLIPIYNTEDNTFFTQFGIRNKNGRNIFNIGGGGRAIWDNWLLGINSFYDHDISGGNRRIGLGVEAWGNYIQLSANSYFRLNNWQQSRDFSDYNERPANGFDIRANAWLPSFPQLGGKLVYEQYFGNHVALQDNHTLQKNPYSLTAGLNYTPFPLLTLGIDQQFGKGGNNDTQLSLQLTYRPGSSWESQINPSSVSGIRQMSENRYNLVERNNNFIFEYKKQDLISITLSKDEISGPENSIHLVSGQVKSKYELSQILWDSDKYISAGGRVSVVNNKNFNLTLPAYKTNGTPGESVEEANTYNINFVATDKKGNKSNSATLKVIVTSSGHSASARFTGTPVVTGSPSPANGTTAVQVGFTVTDGSGNPLPDQDVVITYNDGTSEKSVTVKTDTSGVAQADVTGTRAGDTAVTAQVNGQAQQAVVKFVPDAVSARFTGTPVVTGSPSPANGTTAVQVGFTVTDGSGNPLPDQDVVITYNDGTSEKSVTVKTDTSGVAQADVTGTRAGDTAVTAQVNGQAQQAVVKFVPDAVSARFTGTPVVTGSPSPANGTTAVQVGFTVTDGSGNPLPDQDVVITYNDGTSEKSVTVKTDTSGVAQADVTGTRAGDTAVTAQVNGQAQQAVVKFVPDAVSARFTGTPVVTGSPAQADNSESITLTYKVIDKSGNTLPNQTITISVNNNAVSDNSSVVTDNQGEASFVVRNSQSGTTTVSASINSHDISTDIIFKPVIRTVVANKMLSAKAPVTGYAPVDTISTTAGVLTYSISPSLPAGLVLDSATGVISGTPAAASVVTTYTMTVRDGSSGAENSTTFSLGIAPALAVTQSLYSKVLSMNSNVNLTAINVTGGVSPVVSISPSLPQGLNLNASTGEITGIPTVETGATTYTISVTDQNASPVKRLTLSLTVAPGPVLTVNVQDKMATARASLIYTPVSSVSPVGGALTYSVSPTLPAGLGLNSTNGIISGTPAAASVVTTYTMTVRDGSSGAENSTTFSLGIAPALAVTQSLYSKVLSMNSNVNLTAINVTGGVSPVVSISPSLPQGLNLNASTGEITGIPTVETGATTYTISVTDQNASPVKRLTLSLTVAPGPDLTVNTADKMLAVGAGVNYLPVAGTSPVGGILSYRVSPPLPSGLGLNSTNGVISGTPRAVSSVMTYTMTVRDGRSGAENSVEFNISVLPRFVVTQTIYVRTVTSSTSVNIEVASVSGGSGTYRVSVSPALPTGLDLSIDATSGAVTVSGIPTAAASVQDYAITIQDDVVDGASNTRTLKLTVN
ncbi:inverse autotransporter beta domain-containing protein (plasmid) [Escherichia fergusonii]|uniref:inverse autotransporter beta domain-containing protein n=1 Tax=Escherichia fergusonii TaxID=564 RepID=UPI0024338789|nr:inverse autotransporter beta domain-containing protein [Escherichia fergusonii]WGA39706.1 inverse autotransporter beta domain-containing protein [Escherichia fergusonii]